MIVNGTLLTIAVFYAHSWYYSLNSCIRNVNIAGFFSLPLLRSELVICQSIWNASNPSPTFRAAFTPKTILNCKFLSACQQSTNACILVISHLPRWSYIRHRQGDGPSITHNRSSQCLYNPHLIIYTHSPAKGVNNIVNDHLLINNIYWLLYLF